MMDNEEELESLGEKLYNLIYPKHTDMAPKLTGTDVHVNTHVMHTWQYSTFSQFFGQHISLIKKSINVAIKFTSVHLNHNCTLYM